MSKKQTVKKESKDQLATQFIQREYSRNREILYLISAVQIGRASAYAAFDQNGISIYEFNKTDKRSMFIVERHEWRDFKKVIVDHYFVKSVFSFEGIKNWTLTVQAKGKKLEDVIRRHTDTEVVVLKRAAWRKIVGYRSQTNWKMLVASMIYTWILLAILKDIVPESLHATITVLGGAGTALSIISLILGLFKPKLVLPKLKIKTRKRVVYLYSYLIITCFLAVFLFTKVEADDTKALKSATPATTQTDSKEDQSAQEEATRKAQEEAALKAQQEAERKAQEEAALKAQQEAERKAQEEAALKAKQEEERKAQEEAAAQKAEAERKAQEQAAAQAAAQKTAQQQASTSVYYKNCDAVRAAGAAPIHQGEPGYAKRLDRDGDGIACDR